MTEKTTNACKQCAESETTAHLFSCTGRTVWRKALYAKLFNFLNDHSTAPVITALILNGLRWHYENHHPTVEIGDSHQQAIGWEHLFRGWIDRSWQPLQEQHIRARYPEDKKKIDNSKNWTLHLIEYMWKQGHDLWKDRCDKVHVATGKAETEQQRRVAEAQVNALYKQAEDVGHYDRSRVFGKTIEEKLEEPIQQIEQWIEQAKPAVKQASRDYRKRLKQRTNDIRRYMKTTSTKVTTTRSGVARITRRRRRRKQSTASTELTTQETRRSIFEKGMASTTSNTNAPT
jgi:hypothetical protein